MIATTASLKCKMHHCLFNNDKNASSYQTSERIRLQLLRAWRRVTRIHRPCFCGIDILSKQHLVDCSCELLGVEHARYKSSVSRPTLYPTLPPALRDAQPFPRSTPVNLLLARSHALPNGPRPTATQTSIWRQPTISFFCHRPPRLKRSVVRT